MGTEPVAEAEWRTLSANDVSRVVGQVKGQQALAPDVLEMVARSLQVRRDHPVHFSAHRRQLGDIGVALMSMSAIRVQALPQRRSNTVHLGFMMEGSIKITPREDDPVTVTTGEAFMVTNWSAFDVEAPESIRALHVLIPESALRERGVRIRPARFRLEGVRTLQAPLVALALAAVEQDWAPTSSAQRATSRALEDLAIAFLTESENHDLDREDLRAQLRRRSVEEIVTRHRDPSLNPAALARHLGVSLRHLQRAYEGSGTTISDQIVKHRTDSAVALLLSPGGRDLTVAEQARIAGFASAYELRSAVKLRLGMLPTEVRATALHAISVPE